MCTARRQSRLFFAWWNEWGPLTAAGALVGGAAFLPLLLALLDTSGTSPKEEIMPSIESHQYDSVEIDAMVGALLPLYRLSDGKPMPMPSVRIENDATCTSGGMVSAYSYGSVLIVCEGTAGYPSARLVRVLKHELIHIWITQAGIHDDFPHGREFMRKALEVGTTPDDEPDN